MPTTKRKRYHRSPQRDAILHLVQASHAHPTAEQVFARLKHTYPRLAIGTVYRNLHILAERGEVVPLPFAVGGCRYDGRVDPHYHAVCRRCGDVEDLEMPVADGLEHMASDHSGDFAVESHSVAFYGLCGSCQEAPGAPE